MSRPERDVSGLESVPRGSSRKRWVFFLRLGVGLGLLTFLLLRLDFSRVTIAGPRAQFTGVAVVAVLMILAQGASALRWRVIMGQDAPAVGYLFRLYLIGNFFSLFLPSSIGGDAVRTVAAARATARTAATVSSVIADRLAGVTAMVIYLVVGAVLAPTLLDEVRGRVALNASPALLAIAATVATLAFIAMAVFAPRVRDVLRQGAAVFVDLARSPARLLVVGALAMVVQGLYIVAWWTLGTLLGLDVEGVTYLFTVPVVSLVAMLPVTLSGLGVREGAWLLLLGPLGVPAPDAVAFSLLFFVSFTLVGALGGVLFALRGTEPAIRATDSVESGRRPEEQAPLP